MIIADICEELADCGPNDVCTPNYDDGSWTCECEVEERMRVREQEVDQSVEMGERVRLNSGISRYGTPRASVEWKHMVGGMNRPNQEILVPDWLITSHVT